MLTCIFLSLLTVCVFFYGFFPTRNSCIFTCRGFNEAVNGFVDDGWSMVSSDGMEDITVLVNSSCSKLMGLNLSFVNGCPSTSSVLCAKATMLLQVGKFNLNVSLFSVFFFFN